MGGSREERTREGSGGKRMGRVIYRVYEGHSTQSYRTGSVLWIEESEKSCRITKRCVCYFHVNMGSAPSPHR